MLPFGFTLNAQALNPNHCFIPTYSALGLNLGNQDLAQNLYNRDLVCTGETPFHAYYAPLTNEEHATLNPSNVAWVMKEIEGTHQTSSVNYEALFPITRTSGSEPVCDSTIYTVNNLPAGSSVQWVAIPNIVNLAPSGLYNSSVTVTRSSPSSSGTVTLVAKVSGCSYKELSKAIQVGIDNNALTGSYSGGANGTITNFGNPVMIHGRKNSNYNITVSFKSSYTGTNSYTWAIGGGTGYSSVSFNNGLANFFLGSTGTPTLSLNLTATNSNCGSINRNIVTIANQNTFAGGLYKISPNPASSYIEIQSPIADTKIATISANEPIELILYNSINSTIIRRWRFADHISTRTINISSILPGNYILTITKGEYRQAEKIAIH